MPRISRLNVGRLGANRVDVTTLYANDKDVTKAIAHNTTGGKKFVGGTTAVTGHAYFATGLSTVEVVCAGLGWGREAEVAHGVAGRLSGVAGNVSLYVYTTDAAGDDTTESSSPVTVSYMAIGT